jgi:putative membrane protein
VLYGLLLLVVARQVDVATDAALGAFGAVRDVLVGLGALAAAVAVAALALGLLVLVVATRVGSAFVRHHGYTLWREGRSYRSRAGLFTRKEAAVRIRKVQQLRVYQGAVYRIFGRYRLALPPIGESLDSDDDDDERTGGTIDVDTLGVPWADSALVGRIRSGVFRGEGERLAALPEDEAFARVSRLYIRAAALRFLFVGVPAGIFLLFILSYMVAASWRGEDVDRNVLFMHQLQGWGAASVIWAALSVVLAAPVGWLRWRATAYMHDDGGLSCRSGLIGYSVEAFLFRKAQGVTVTQSPLQRRHGLATLEVETACGSVTVPYIEHARVCALRDLIVYKVESSRRRWY